MDIDEFQADWNKVTIKKKDKAVLQLMTQVKNHPKIKRMRMKFIIECIALIIFVFLYYDGFDGHTKPLWINIVLVASAVTYILTRIFGWRSLRNPIRADNLKESLARLHTRLKRIALFNVIASFSFAISMILFFSSVIVFTPKKYVMLIGMVLTLGILVLISSRNWITQIKDIKKTLEGFQEVSSS